MYVRIAQFEGMDPDRMDALAAERMQGDPPPGLEKVKRGMMLVDRATGRAANLMFCDSEEDMRSVDEAMNNMNPGDSGGRRTSVAVYEVIGDRES
jgi:hypothetical protein